MVIGNSVFRGCISLNDFQTNINHIGKYLLVNTGFEILDIPESISIINEHALSNISTLRKIIINNVNIKIHYNQIMDSKININIIINVKKSELIKVLKFIINNQHFIVSSSKISIYRMSSNALTDLKEMIKMLDLNDDLLKYLDPSNSISNSKSSKSLKVNESNADSNSSSNSGSKLKTHESGLNFDDSKYKIFYILLVQQYFINEEESNIKQLVSKINKSNLIGNELNIAELDILNNNLKEKLIFLKELRDIYDLYKSKLDE